MRVRVAVIIERIVSVARAGGQGGWRCLVVATARKSGVGISRTGCRAAKTTGATAVRMASVEDLGTLWSCERTGKWRERRALLRRERSPAVDGATDAAATGANSERDREQVEPESEEVEPEPPPSADVPISRVRVPVVTVTFEDEGPLGLGWNGGADGVVLAGIREGSLAARVPGLQIGMWLLEVDNTPTAELLEVHTLSAIVGTLLKRRPVTLAFGSDSVTESDLIEPEPEPEPEPELEPEPEP